MKISRFSVIPKTSSPKYWNSGKLFLQLLTVASPTPNHVYAYVARKLSLGLQTFVMEIPHAPKSRSYSALERKIRWNDWNSSPIEGSVWRVVHECQKRVQLVFSSGRAENHGEEWSFSISDENSHQWWKLADHWTIPTFQFLRFLETL